MRNTAVLVLLILGCGVAVPESSPHDAGGRGADEERTIQAAQKCRLKRPLD
jgi:hypothetical protein